MVFGTTIDSMVSPVKRMFAIQSINDTKWGAPNSNQAPDDVGSTMMEADSSSSAHLNGENGTKTPPASLRLLKAKSVKLPEWEGYAPPETNDHNFFFHGQRAEEPRKNPNPTPQPRLTKRIDWSSIPSLPPPPESYYYSEPDDMDENKAYEFKVQELYGGDVQAQSTPFRKRSPVKTHLVKTPSRTPDVTRGGKITSAMKRFDGDVDMDRDNSSVGPRSANPARIRPTTEGDDKDGVSTPRQRQFHTSMKTATFPVNLPLIPTTPGFDTSLFGVHRCFSWYDSTSFSPLDSEEERQLAAANNSGVTVPEKMLPDTPKSESDEEEEEHEEDGDDDEDTEGSGSDSESDDEHDSDDPNRDPTRVMAPKPPKIEETVESEAEIEEDDELDGGEDEDEALILADPDEGVDNGPISPDDDDDGSEELPDQEEVEQGLDEASENDEGEEEEDVEEESEHGEEDESTGEEDTAHAEIEGSVEAKEEENAEVEENVEVSDEENTEAEESEDHEVGNDNNIVGYAEEDDLPRDEGPGNDVAETVNHENADISDGEPAPEIKKPPPNKPPKRRRVDSDGAYKPSETEDSEEEFSDDEPSPKRRRGATEQEALEREVTELTGVNIMHIDPPQVEQAAEHRVEQAQELSPDDEMAPEEDPAEFEDDDVEEDAVGEDAVEEDAVEEDAVEEDGGEEDDGAAADLKQSSLKVANSPAFPGGGVHATNFTREPLFSSHISVRSTQPTWHPRPPKASIHDAKNDRLLTQRNAEAEFGSDLRSAYEPGLQWCKQPISASYGDFSYIYKPSQASALRSTNAIDTSGQAGNPLLDFRTQKGRIATIGQSENAESRRELINSLTFPSNIQLVEPEMQYFFCCCLCGAISGVHVKFYPEEFTWSEQKCTCCNSHACCQGCKRYQRRKVVPRDNGDGFLREYDPVSAQWRRTGEQEGEQLNRAEAIEGRGSSLNTGEDLKNSVKRVAVSRKGGGSGGHLQKINWQVKK